MFCGAKAEVAREIWLVDKAPKVIDKLKTAVKGLADFMKSQGLAANPEAVKELFLSSATDLKRERAFQGSGLVDLMRALQSV